MSESVQRYCGRQLRLGTHLVPNVGEFDGTALALGWAETRNLRDQPSGWRAMMAWAAAGKAMMRGLPVRLAQPCVLAGKTPSGRRST